MKVIIGLGLTGLSCLRYCVELGYKVAVVDSRLEPPESAALQKEFPYVPVTFGTFDSPYLKEADELIVSPGVSLKEPPIAAQLALSKSAVGDIELFARVVKKPIVAITGSNGKTTVTSLVGKMVADAGHSVVVCGNIGDPVLSTLNRPSPDYYVLEISSFQLETTESLKPSTAVVLNLCPDHMDRYETYEDYAKAKQRIYKNCLRPVVNLDEPELWRHLNLNNPLGFSLQAQGPNDFCLRKINDEIFLAIGEQPLMNVKKLKLKQTYDFQNALAALALGKAIQLPIESMLHTLENFQGLPHRCQWVGEYNGVHWYDDSKGTNAGATIAALLSLGAAKTGRLWLIAGGDSKKADLSSLMGPVHQYVDQLILLGKDATILEKLLGDKVPTQNVSSMEEAVNWAAERAKPGDIVLLSPACASLDMFRNYAHRGEVFVKALHNFYA